MTPPIPRLLHWRKMQGLSFLLLILAIVAAAIGGWAKNFWAVATGIILLAAVLVLGGVKL